MSIEEPIVKTIVCLANSSRNSYKDDGRCIAGKAINEESVNWIRPVGASSDEEVSKKERQYEGGGFPQLLDIIDVPLLEKKPKFHQKENWLLYPNSCWKKKGRMRQRDLEQLIYHDPLWIDEHNVSNKRNDRIAFSLAKDLSDSLRLIRVDELTFSVFPSSFGRRVHGKFLYCGNKHELVVTDHERKQIYEMKPDGDYKIGDSFLTVSLAGYFKNTDACHLLIAGIISCGETSGT